MKKSSLRDSMPSTTAFIDACRDAFGAQEVNEAIRAGMEGFPMFWASENGHEVGTRLPDPVSYVTAGQMVLNPLPMAKKGGRN